jgi:class 3 adenylate cyclase
MRTRKRPSPLCPRIAPIIDALITAGRGHITGSAGDSVLAEFASIIDAVHCGVAIQQALGQANAALAPERRMELASASTWAMSCSRMETSSAMV